MLDLWVQPGSFRLPFLVGKIVCAFAESETGCETAQFSVRWSEVRVFHPGTHTKAVPSARYDAAVMLYRRSYVVSSCAFSSPVFGARSPSTSEGRKRRSRSSGLCCYTKPPVTYHQHPPISISVAPSTLSRKRCCVSLRHASACNQLRNTRVSLGRARGCNPPPS